MNESVVPKASPDPLPEIGVFLAPFAPLFHNRQSWHSVERYLTGLLTDLPHKTCDTIAAAVAGTSTERLQHLLTDAAWDPVALDEQRVRRLATQSAPGGILVLDDTGLPKQGKASVGVARQYSGTLGKHGNCQVVVSAEYVEPGADRSDPLHWPVSARLYLPEQWASNPTRRHRAKVPEEVAFQTKPQLAIDLVDHARDWGVPFALVVADAGYGDNPSFLRALEQREVPYICAVERTFGVRLPAEVAVAGVVPPHRGRGQPRKARPAPLHTARSLLDQQPDQDWRTVVWRQGSGGAPLGCQVLALRVHRATGGSMLTVNDPRVTLGPEGWLVGERPLPGEQGDEKWYFSTLPAEVPWEQLIAWAHQRWVIEQFYEDAKGECGLDHYQGRTWGGLHRHLALVMLTYSFLALRRAASAAGGFPPLSATMQSASSTPRHPALAVRGPSALAHRHRPHQVLPSPQNLTK